MTFHAFCLDLYTFNGHFDCLTHVVLLRDRSEASKRRSELPMRYETSCIVKLLMFLVGVADESEAAKRMIS